MSGFAHATLINYDKIGRFSNPCVKFAQIL